jgi:hypothetical protein
MKTRHLMLLLVGFTQEDVLEAAGVRGAPLLSGVELEP